MTNFATKDDLLKELKPIRTDIKSIDARMDRFFDGLLELKTDMKDLKKRVNQILNNQDSIFKFIKDTREEHIILANGHRKVLEMSGRIEKIEKIHPDGQHTSV